MPRPRRDSGCFARHRTGGAGRGGRRSFLAVRLPPRMRCRTGVELHASLENPCDGRVGAGGGRPKTDNSRKVSSESAVDKLRPATTLLRRYHHGKTAAPPVGRSAISDYAVDRSEEHTS